MTFYPKPRLCGLLLFLLAFCSRPARADVGLVIEGSTGPGGFFSDLGHSAVWISRACVDPQGRLYFCEGTRGSVVSGSGYWLADGAAAIPAADYFLGPDDIRNADERSEWARTMAPAYPDVPAAAGAKFMGRVWGRQERVDVFPTTPEQDRLAIAQVQALRDRFRFTTFRQNCANFSLAVLRLWTGPSLRVRTWPDVGIMTPVALEHGLFTTLGKAPHGGVVTYRFPPPRHLLDRRPARDGCSALLFDPKYAATLLVVDPFAYLGAGGCYAWVTVHDNLQSRHATVGGSRTPFHRSRSATPEEVFAALTASDPPATLPSSAPAISAPSARIQ